MLLINSITYAIHPGTRHHISCRTGYRFVVDRPTALTADEMIKCHRGLVPLASVVVH